MKSILDRLKTLWHDFQRHQNRSVVWGAKFGVILIIFFIIYLPAQGEYGSLSKSLGQRNKDIASAKQSGLNLLQPQELEEAAKNANNLESQFFDVAQASKAIDLVSDEAAKHNFTISNINSEALVPVNDEAGKEIERSGKKLKRIPVHIQFETNFKNIADFLRALTESSGHLWVLESLSIQKTAPQSEDLKCQMTLSFFAY